MTKAICNVNGMYIRLRPPGNLFKEVESEGSRSPGWRPQARRCLERRVIARRSARDAAWSEPGKPHGRGFPGGLRLKKVCGYLALLCVVAFSALPVERALAETSPSQKAALPAQAQRSLELNEKGVAAIKLRDFSHAEALFTEALAIDSKNITAVFNLAGMYITNKKEPQAIALLQKYTQEFPKDAGLRARLGDAYFSSQDPQNAALMYEQAYKLDPKYPTLPVRLATVYSMTKKLDKAAAMYERAIKANPKDLQSLRNLSSLYLALNKPHQAITTVKRALQLSSSSDLYITLGSAYQDLKDPKNALIAFRRAREMGHKDPELSKIIENLEKATAEKKRA